VGLLLTLTAGLVLWIVLWAINFKAFDAFLITLLLVILAATARMLVPYLPGNRPGPD
jgi:Mn2+/Fe2+ NRAMP family transporter